jgi:PAS domain S-box-containing protein
VNTQKDRHGSDDSIEMCQRAEAALRGSGSDTDKLLAQQVRHLIHELEVFEVELEMQNEELHRDHEELEAVRERYAGLYDSTPIGYLTVSDKEQILEANLTAARLFGTERGVLLGQSLSWFIAPEYHDVRYKHFKAVLAATNGQTCEMRMVARDGSPFDVRMQSMGLANNDGTFTKW